MANSNLPQVPAADAEKPEVQPAAVLRSHVLATLGRPPALLRVHVARLWQNHYRVNVLVGASFTTARCAHSYFVHATDAGAPVTSTPALLRVYT